MLVCHYDARRSCFLLLELLWDSTLRTVMENEAAVLRDAAADAQAVYTFVGWMLVIGALSLVAVQRRKLKSASLYDRRSKA